MAVRPLIVIVGPTASGKTKLAIEIAKQYGGEIIAADSRTIYKDLDIGTAKPSIQEQQGIPHFGLDLVAPGEPFSAADFKVYAEQKISEIRGRGHVPILVGGTGLYVDGVVFDYRFGASVDTLTREKYNTLSTEELQQELAKNNIELPDNKNNKRYLVRALEQGGVNQQRLRRPIYNTFIVGIETPPKILRERIEARAAELFKNGMLDEALKMGEKYGWESEAMTGNIYKLAHKFAQGELDEKELVEKFTTADWRLAKRQMTWLRRNKFITWLSLNEASAYIAGLLEDNE